MQYRVTELLLPFSDDVIVKYTLEYKKHWWNRWKFLMDGRMPQLLNKRQIVKMTEHVKKKRNNFCKLKIKRKEK